MKDNNDSRNIVYLGFAGKLERTASSEKLKLVSKALSIFNCKVSIIHKKWSHLDRKEKSNKYFEDSKINLIQPFKNLYRPNNFIFRNVLRVLKPIIEFSLLNNLVKNEKIDYGFVITRNIFEMGFYRIISNYLNFKIVLVQVEYNSSMTNRQNLYHKINDYFFEKYSFKMIDGGLPISNFLVKLMKSSNHNLKIFKLPVLVDFDKINSINNNIIKDYFLFCGGASFSEVIEFVIEAFELLDTNKINLRLICHGNKNELKIIKQKILESPKSKMISLLHGLEYVELINCYKEALALLIPLRETDQDKARFPHKIGEYAASGRPIISNNYGEILNYFEDDTSAFFAKEFTVNSFANKMQYVIDYPDIATQVGKNGKIIAQEKFNYKTFGKKLKEFVNQL